MNAMLSQAAAEVEGVQVINIYDYPVAPDVYRDVVKQAKGIVYEFPFYCVHRADKQPLQIQLW